ncbi:MAG: hypothetical protein IJN04_07145 [Clostridia bacterium]|nr:hypothetical protein [Clostridia bacterium]
MKRKEKWQRLQEKRQMNDTDAMTEEQRLAHEQYIRELTAANQKTVRKVCAVLWILAMIGWIIFLVLEIVLYGSPLKMLFYGVGMALTALPALPRLLDFFAARKKNDEDTEA